MSYMSAGVTKNPTAHRNSCSAATEAGAGTYTRFSWLTSQASYRRYNTV